MALQERIQEVIVTAAIVKKTPFRRLNMIITHSNLFSNLNL